MDQMGIEAVVLPQLISIICGDVHYFIRQSVTAKAERTQQNIIHNSHKTFSAIQLMWLTKCQL